MTRYTLNLTPQLYQYLLDVSLREHPVLQALRDETQKLPAARMQISPEQGQFMALLIELMGARKTLEVGVFTGYSTLAVALALPEDGKIIACDIDERPVKIAKTFWEQANVTHKIDLRIAPALTTLEQLIQAGEENSFDFAFIDADKANYANYYEQALTLVRPGGLILFDNTLWGGDVIDLNVNDNATRAIRAINEKIHQDERVSMSLLPLGDGVTLVRKNIEGISKN
jgi:predicted O-methyltransferase YrrM